MITPNLGYLGQPQNNLIVLARDWEILLIYEAIDANISKAELIKRYPDLYTSWDIPSYFEHPEDREVLRKEMVDDISDRINRFSELSERILNRKTEDASSGRQVGRRLVPSLKEMLIEKIPFFGRLLFGYSKGFGEALLKGLREANVDPSDPEAIYKQLGDPDWVKNWLKNSREAGGKEAWN